MSEAAKQLNIYQRLAKIRAAVDILQKDKSGYGYNYLSSEEILPRIQALMEKHKVSLIPKIVPRTLQVTQYHFVETKTTKSGEPFEKHNNEILVQSDMEYVWLCDENPSDCVVVPWGMVGQQSDASQAYGSGLSYAERYFLLKYFNVATTNDDPEQLQKRKQEAADLEAREVAKAVIARVHELVTSYMRDHEDERTEITKLIKKYVVIDGKPSANYNAVTNPETARQLLGALTEYMKIEV